jgi:arginyl-tRNA synthetase
VKLQGGDEYFLQMWRKLVDITMSQNQMTYDRLNVTLTRKDVMGESLYNSMLPGIVADLKAKGWRWRAKAQPWCSWTSSRTKKASRWV